MDGQIEKPIRGQLINWIKSLLMNYNRRRREEVGLCKYLGHGYEHGAGLVLLPDVGQAREDEHSHDDHQHQQPQLLVATTWTQCQEIWGRRYYGKILYFHQIWIDLFIA